MRKPGDLDRRRVGVGGIGVRHRLDDDGMGRSDEDAANVDADRRPSLWPELIWRGHRLGLASAAEAARDIEAGHPDEEREQEDETDHVRQLLGSNTDP